MNTDDVPTARWDPRSARLLVRFDEILSLGSGFVFVIGPAGTAYAAWCECFELPKRRVAVTSSLINAPV